MLSVFNAFSRVVYCVIVLNVMAPFFKTDCCNKNNSCNYFFNCNAECRSSEYRVYFSYAECYSGEYYDFIVWLTAIMPYVIMLSVSQPGKKPFLNMHD